MKTPFLGLNRITLPDYSLSDFFDFAAKNGFSGVELRNDLPGKSILDAYAPVDVRKMSRSLGLDIISINALQRFNDPESEFPKRIEELKSLLKISAAIGCHGLVLCPVNDLEDSRSEVERQEDTVRALRRFGPFFADSGVQGWIEPLGFPQCSLRFKENAVDAIGLSGFGGVYRIVHDTFHHFLSGEVKIFPRQTGLVHISGVEEDKQADAVLDADRVLVTPRDIMANAAQIGTLIQGHFKGFFSFECFSPAVLPEDIVVSRDYLFPRRSGS